VLHCRWHAARTQKALLQRLLIVRRSVFMTQFNTSFAEMDALSGRNQTTHGIWLARSPKVRHGCLSCGCAQQHSCNDAAPHG